MTDKEQTLAKHAKRRRDFLKKGAGAATVAPAVGLLLQAGTKPAYAQSYGGGGTVTRLPTVGLTKIGRAHV